MPFTDDNFQREIDELRKDLHDQQVQRLEDQAEWGTWRGGISAVTHANTQRIGDMKVDVTARLVESDVNFNRRVDKLEVSIENLTKLAERTLEQALVTNGRVNGHDAALKPLPDIAARVSTLERSGRFSVKQILGAATTLCIAGGGVGALGSALHWFG